MLTNNNSPSNNDTLDSIPATRGIIDTLFLHKLISNEARNHGIQLLYPRQNWGFWISKLLLVLGVSLILSGIIYFFAFNWNKMPSAIKFTLIQAGILGCVIGYIFCKQKLFLGKLFLLAAGVLVGVFLAVFGQIYQTGADSYNLFMMWALFILPWVIISEFAVFWIIWLIVSNIALDLFWTQAALPNLEAEYLIYPYLILFNGLFLILRELLCIKGVSWLQDRWTRIVPSIFILLFALIPIFEFIGNPLLATYSVILGTLFSIGSHLAFYFVYQYKIPDLSVITATFLSVCIILEFAIFKVLVKLFEPNYTIIYFLIGAITPIVFTLAIVILRVIAKKMEKNHE